MLSNVQYMLWEVDNTSNSNSKKYFSTLYLSNCNDILLWLWKWIKYKNILNHARIWFLSLTLGENLRPGCNLTDCKINFALFFKKLLTKFSYFTFFLFKKLFV